MGLCKDCGHSRDSHKAIGCVVAFSYNGPAYAATDRCGCKEFVATDSCTCDRPCPMSCQCECHWGDGVHGPTVFDPPERDADALLDYLDKKAKREAERLDRELGPQCPGCGMRGAHFCTGGQERHLGWGKEPFPEADEDREPEGPPEPDPDSLHDRDR